MKYIVFLTRNLKQKINGNSRIYIGVHATENPEMFDGYLGEGISAQQASTFMYPKTPLQCAVKKYGVSSFERDTLYVYDTKEEAYRKLNELVTPDFIQLTHTYNRELPSYNGYVYQFNLEGKIVKKWKSFSELTDFYSYPAERFIEPVNRKCMFLNSYWKYTPIIKLEEYSPKYINTSTFIYSESGKLLKIVTKEECAKLLNCSIEDVEEAFKNQRLLNGKYVSNKLTDLFIPKPRRNYLKQTFYVYKVDGSFLGTYKGKAIMKILNLHSWQKISNIFSINHNWYKDFYVSLEPVKEVPNKQYKTKIDVYDRYGNHIETLNSVKEVKDKYQIPAAKLKHIQQGEKYWENYIFKYSSK